MAILSSSRRRLAIVGLLIVALGLGAWAMLARTAQPPANTVRVTRGTINATVEAAGRARPVTQAQLSLRLAGRVASVKVAPGDLVTAGQPLLNLETEPFEREVRQAELDLTGRRQRADQARAGASPAEVEAAQAAAREALVAREVAQARYDERAEKPDATTSAEAAQLEAAKAAYQRARATLEKALSGASPEELAALQTAVEQGELALANARSRLAEATLSAPFAGTVLDVTTRVGENVNAGQPLLLLADPTRLVIEADVDEVDAPSVQPGQRADIRLDAFPGETLTATVSRVAPAATTQQGAVSYRTTLDLAPHSLALKPGMGATARIATRSKPDALLVPSRAVQTVGRSKVVKVVRGGRVVDVEVRTGLSDRQRVEIVEGLSEGELVQVE